MDLSTASAWLAYLATLHGKEIDLGLDRVNIVAKRLNVLASLPCVITVAGTNGKGSTVAGLEAIYRAADYRTGAFTSPFLFSYNEQIRIDGQMVSDEDLCKAFALVEKARGEISLTVFEFGTLAALVLFAQSALDVWILEVGLGGRLDAVNVVDADVAVITSIAIDHVDFLGDTREKIAIEKAGIFRSHKPVVCGDLNPPHTLLQAAEKMHAPFYQCGKDFHFQEAAITWSFTNQTIEYKNLVKNALLTQNMAVVLEVISLLQTKLAVTEKAIIDGLKNIKLPGRMQIIKGEVTKIYDVAHNPAAVTLLAENLAKHKCEGKTHAVFSMLQDKDIEGSIIKIKNLVDAWYVAPLTIKRAASKSILEKSFASVDIHPQFFASVQDAYQHAVNVAKAGDRIVVFGSFYTVGDVLKLSLV